MKKKILKKNVVDFLGFYYEISLTLYKLVITSWHFTFAITQFLFETIF